MASGTRAASKSAHPSCPMWSFTSLGVACWVWNASSGTFPRAPGHVALCLLHSLPLVTIPVSLASGSPRSDPECSSPATLVLLLLCLREGPELLSLFISSFLDRDGGFCCSPCSSWGKQELSRPLFLIFSQCVRARVCEEHVGVCVVCVALLPVAPTPR